jgi:fucose-1-phosphate guanylyltransferase
MPPPAAKSITALAHPASLLIGSTHGVFLLADPEGECVQDMKLAPSDRKAMIKHCRKFLHKPSIQRMREEPGLINVLDVGVGV